MSSSIMSNEKKCFRCGTTYNLHRHHVYAGAFRNKSEQFGCWCYLCAEHHVGDTGVHNQKGSKYWLYLKQLCQTRFEMLYGHEQFMKIFKRNWL